MTTSTDRPASRSSGSRPAGREPIRSPLLWVGFGLALLLLVPWWAPEGSIDPIVLGVPWWFAVSFVGSACFSAVACWACLRHWDLVEDEEQAAEARARDEEAAR